MATYYSDYSNEYRLRLVITQGTQNITNNTSVVSWTLSLLSGSKSMSVYSTYHATVNGVTSPSTTQTNVDIGYNSTVTLGSGSTTVTHNSDGTKSVPFSASFKTNSAVYYGGVLVSPGTMTISGSFALTTIPRYAAITAFTASIDDREANLTWTADKTISEWRWSSNSGSTYSGWITVNASSGSRSIDVTPGTSYGWRIQVKNSESGLITTSSVVSKAATKTPSTLSLGVTSQDLGGSTSWSINESYDYTHKIRYQFGDANGYILGSASARSNTESGTWTVPTSLANIIPNATSGWARIYLETYYGERHVGTTSRSFEVTVPNNSTWQPSIPSVTITDAGSRPTGITSYVQGKAKAKVVSSSTAKGGASISSYRVTVSGIGTYYGSNVTSGSLNKSGTVTVTVRATDSRGYYREKSNEITVWPYSPPKMTTYTASRSPNSQGTDLAANLSYSISQIDGQNAKEYRIRYRPTGGTWVTWVGSTDYWVRTTSPTATGVLDVNNSYEVEFYIKDSYTSVTRIRNIGTAFQLLDFNASGRGVAFGKVSEGDNFEVALTTILPHRPILRGLYTGTDNETYLQFMESDGSTRQGWVGFGSSANDYLSIANEFGSRIVMNKDLYIDGNLTWHAGNSSVIEESGSNTNGRYIKFSDGTMICHMTVTVNYTTAGTTTYTFPATFVGTPACSVSFQSGSNVGYRTAIRNSVLQSVPTSILLTTIDNASVGSLDAYILAIGRWK